MYFTCILAEHDLEFTQNVHHVSRENLSKKDKSKNLKKKRCVSELGRKT